VDRFEEEMCMKRIEELWGGDVAMMIGNNLEGGECDGSVE